MANAPLGPNESGIARTLVRPFGRLIGHTASESYDPGTGGTGEPSYDTDAAAYFDAVETAGGSFDLSAIDGTYTESYVKTAHSDFYAGLKTDGLWDKLTEFYLLVGKTFDGLTVKGKGTGTLTNNNFVSGDLLAAGAGAGLTGDGTSKYIQTGLNADSGFVSSIGAYSTVANDISGRTISSEDTASYGVVLNSSTALGIFYWDGSYIEGHSVDSTKLNSLGFVIGTSRSNSEQEIYINGSSANTSTDVRTTSSGAYEFFLYRRNTTPSLDFNGSLSFAFISPTTALTDTDASNLTNRVETLMDALGCGVIA